ncbi:catalase family peroxidase [Salinarimonas soli]|uniref:Catalase-related peroxidase n=1 Tax=Salinarimonas soli TaxID=1638099 RepID=A0A5B2VC74_9HYPH|nr:catalase family peroxidase [Salinarimonas soli]KAA2236594.1 catalase family peroxidase [Salinarimonas soli]
MSLLDQITGGAGGLSPRAVILRLCAIGAVTAASASGFAYAGGWLSPGRLTPERMIDGFQEVNGVHPGFRRNHAKGLCVEGRFESSGAAAGLTRVRMLAPGVVLPITGRVALAVGTPDAADAAGTVRSLALRVRLADGEEWRTGMNSLPVFLVRTPEAFYEQILAGKPDPATGKPDPARMKAFFAAHPESVRAAALINARTITSGFADSTYASLNAYRFVAADGTETPVRWAMVPERAPVAQGAADAGRADPNYLFDDLEAELRRAPLRWRLVVTLGRPGDPTADATLPWPSDRKTVDAGTLVLTGTAAEGPGNCRDVNFDPLVLPDGIAPSDDPLLSARSAAYSQSFTRRAGEPKSPSPVKDPPVQGAAL